MDWLNYIYTTILTGALAGIGFLIRKILTSEKKIEMLELQLSSLEEDIHESKADIKDILMVLVENNKFDYNYRNYTNKNP